MLVFCKIFVANTINITVGIRRVSNSSNIIITKALHREKQKRAFTRKEEKAVTS